MQKPRMQGRLMFVLIHFTLRSIREEDKLHIILRLLRLQVTVIPCLHSSSCVDTTHLLMIDPLVHELQYKSAKYSSMMLMMSRRQMIESLSGWHDSEQQPPYHENELRRQGTGQYDGSRCGQHQEHAEQQIGDGY